jgi:hypothetical protein
LIEFLNHIVTGDDTRIPFVNIETNSSRNSGCTRSYQAEKIKQMSAFQKGHRSYSLGQEMSTDGGNRAKRSNNNFRSKTQKKLSRMVKK